MVSIIIIVNHIAFRKQNQSLKMKLLAVLPINMLLFIKASRTKNIFTNARIKFHLSSV